MASHSVVPQDVQQRETVVTTCIISGAVNTGPENQPDVCGSRTNIYNRVLPQADAYSIHSDLPLDRTQITYRSPLKQTPNLRDSVTNLIEKRIVSCLEWVCASISDWERNTNVFKQ